MKKPSEIFEGENSSLKKTFDSVTTPKEEEIREEFAKNFRTGLGAWHPNYEMVTDYILKIRREAIAERDEEIKKSIEEVYKNAKEDHICRFNDGDSDCECYYTAINDILASLTQE